jgi:predicted nuclease of predicted toxin-antitoxin system
LARFLQQKGLDSLHVSDIGLEAATDEMIWQYATRHDLVIVSKDTDFIRRVQLGGPKPQILWVRAEL